MDFNFQAVDGLAQGAASVGGAISAAADLLAAFKSLVNSTERGREADVERAVEQLALTIENAQLQNALLNTQLLKFKDEVGQAQAAQAQLQRYALHETESGEFVYALKPEDQNGEPFHFICPKCREHGTRSILQGDAFVKKCKECRAAFNFDKPPARPQQRQIDYLHRR